MSLGREGIEKPTLSQILDNEDGRHVVEFAVENIRLDDWRAKNLAWRLSPVSTALADKLFRRMIEVESEDPDILGSYAVLFLMNERGDLDAAETYYKRAIEADPKHANNLGNYALFLENERGDPDGAETYYKRAIEADPKHANNLGNYATFLKNERGDPDGAETYYKRAMKAAPKNASILGKYATFLANERGDLDAAETYFKRSTIEADPKHATCLGNYGQFLVGTAQQLEGQKMLLSAVNAIQRLDRDNVSGMGELCVSLWLVSRIQGHDATQWERGFKYCIQKDFKQPRSWTFDSMLKQAEATLSQDEFAYAKALSAAFLDAGVVADLERFGPDRAPVDPWIPRASRNHSVKTATNRRLSTT